MEKKESMKLPWSVNSAALCTPSVRRAYDFANAAHQSVGQLRKYTEEPYIVHPHEVASIVSAFGAPMEVLQAAYLHDVLEDTPVTPSDLRGCFGEVVCDLVVQLTDVSTPADGVRAQRKALDHAHSARGSAWAQTIKCADIYSNVKSIVQHDPKFAAFYVVEKLDQIAGLVRAHAHLREHVQEFLHTAQRQVGPPSRKMHR